MSETQQQELASAEMQSMLKNATSGNLGVLAQTLAKEAEQMDTNSRENKRGTSEPEDKRRGKGGQKWPRGDSK